MGLKEKVYRVLVASCKSDKTSKRFYEGETFTDKDFSLSVIANWLSLGIIEEVSNGGNGKR